MSFAMEAALHLPKADEAVNGGHGEVFTRRWVVDLILDLVGYTEDRDLGALTALEPSCGRGAFLIPMVQRLITSCKRHERDLSTVRDAIVAFDLLGANVDRSRRAVGNALLLEGTGVDVAAVLVASWINRRDFLLQPLPDSSVDFVVGNPPYIRLEAVPRQRSDAYRRACSTMSGRADVYIGFYEHGLLALKHEGGLAFICADRWMRNAYGARLREMVASGWSVDAVVSLTGVDAFEEEVDAYPAVTVIRRTPQSAGPLVVEGAPDFGAAQAKEVAELASVERVEHVHRRGYRAARLHSWFTGGGGWPSGSPDRLALIADLEAEFPPLEDPSTSTKVGIGVATGADKIYIVRDPNLMEIERLLPIALPDDIATGKVEWSGRFLVNPWNSSGLVGLDAWPRFAEYLRRHRDRLARRHTAKSGRWYRTIDRVTPALTLRPKLYIPDFKEVIFPVLDEGRTYPHHNLYWVTSDGWDLRVLGGLMLSDVANLFIEAYSVRMRGGFLRFQAQYLRRIRLPRIADVDDATSAALSEAFDARDRGAATRVALRLYGFNELPA
jgi:hypothetical protein